MMKKSGIALLVAGLLSAFAGFLGVGYAGADASWNPADNAVINPGNVPATAPGFEVGDDCGGSAALGGLGWYFVLPPGKANGATEIVSIDVQFQGAGLIGNAPFIHPNGQLNKAIVYTSEGDTLLDARAVVAPAPDPAPAEFNLSHVCHSSSSSSSSAEHSSSEHSSSEDHSSSSADHSSSSADHSSSSADHSSSSADHSSSEQSSSEDHSSSSADHSSSVESSSVESSSVESSSSQVTSVLSSSVDQSSSQSDTTAATVLAAETERAAALPRTGVDPTRLVTIGMLMALAGGALALSSDRLIARRRS
jgi:hypothetical protein